MKLKHKFDRRVQLGMQIFLVLISVLLVVMIIQLVQGV